MTGRIIKLFDDIFSVTYFHCKNQEQVGFGEGKAITHFSVSHIPMFLEYDVRVNIVTSDYGRNKNICLLLCSKTLSMEMVKSMEDEA
jgi:hypothetical protein